MNEPSILDYLKSRLNPWQKEKIEIPASLEPEDGEAGSLQESLFDTEAYLDDNPDAVIATDGDLITANKLSRSTAWPWRTLFAIALGLTAQLYLEPPASITLSIGLYCFALFFLTWSYFANEFVLPEPEDVSTRVDPQTYHSRILLSAAFLALVAFVLFTGNLFTTLNVTIWLASIALFVRGLWLNNPQKLSLIKRVGDFIKRNSWQITLSRWALLIIGLAIVIVFFRFYRLDGIPNEPFSDHAEKLLDVYDITQEQTHIFFPRNTGREFIQFYWTAFLANLLGSGLTFISLKIGTVLIGLFTLPYVYLLGKEVGGKRVALFALTLAGVSYWLNTISRIGLRFPLYPAFTAPALYYLIRGLRRQQRNDFILAGLFLGLGLHGYSPFRFVPLVMLLGLGLYLLHRQSHGNRAQTLMMFSMLVIASLLVFLPLMRYAIENPDNFSMRALSRLTGEGNPLPGPAWQIFISNTFNAMSMFNVDDGEIWVHSVTHRPALDVVSALLFVFGYIFILVRYLRKRDWLDLFLILSVPLLLMPSILSLAFPRENPSLNRTGAAAIIVFVIAGMALDGLYKGLRGGLSNRRNLAVGTVVLLLLISGLHNYSLVFDQFATQFANHSLNTSDMGAVIKSFVQAGNNSENAYVVPFPYWVDTRLVGIQAGYPTKDYALWRDNLASTLPQPGAKVFIVKEEDRDTLDALYKLYPDGLVGHFISPMEGKNFWIYTVPDNLMVKP